MKSFIRACGWLLCAGLLVLRLAAATPGDAAVRRLLVQAVLASGPERLQLLTQLSTTGSHLARDVMAAWTRDEILLYHPSPGVRIPVLLEDQQDADGKARALRLDTGLPLRDAHGRVLRFTPDDLDSVDTDMRLRGAIQQALDVLALSDPSPDERQSAALTLGNSQRLQYLPALRARLEVETDPQVRKTLAEAEALLQLDGPVLADRIAAADRLGRLEDAGAVDRLRRVQASGPPALSAAAARALAVIAHHMAVVNFVGTIFRGASQGSILLVVALGLAITFGLMGVINMAHGEMIAVGAYTSYVVQNLFGAGFSFHITLPFDFGGRPLGFGFSLPGLNATGGWYESYFLFVLPLSFLAAALAGVAVERTVIRFLYRRPLESLLATWGVSLIMQQLFRMVFGANNVQVNSPSWLLGHFSIHDVELGYNRVFVIAFAIVIVLGTWLLLTRTALGLLIRAVMQNHDMASCLGVRTERVNMLTFAFGSGLAGLAGAFLSQIGNVGPSLGQNYIVDSFMVVVVGGVGSIVGTVCSAVGIGTSDQVLQQVSGSPVMGKIIVLGIIILFLQWKPGGLFATRSRSLD
ncbi:MAG TPA: urea ABC transporter permease subunit UrtB [Opitutaceae bacterium]|jgi:urea transport system permease protein|nr:urea ABC transporter permease subunit UrtB [Opitutaceae bacterium]